jgi:membrane protease YdiL (CAAX protease family)
MCWHSQVGKGGSPPLFSCSASINWLDSSSTDGHQIAIPRWSRSPSKRLQIPNIFLKFSDPCFDLGGLSVPILESTGVPTATGTGGDILINCLVALFPALLLGWLWGRLLEGLPFRALGVSFTNGWFRNLVLGGIIGGVTLSLAVLIAFAFGGLRFTPNNVDFSGLLKSLAIAFVVFAAGAAWEEALFRGYLLQTFTRSGLAWFGIALTSLFFGTIHLQNPNADVISTINTVLAGVWFGIAYLKTRDLWFVWGLHLMWNWMQGAFFGIEVSGITDLVSVPLLKEIDSGPTWLTGSTYGVEGGIVTTIAILVSMVVIYFCLG